MPSSPRFQRLAFFTRLLDAAPAAERYRLAAEQIAFTPNVAASTPPGSRSTISTSMRAALPSPFVFLGHVAAQTSRIRLGTGIITLPLELPVRVAEDAIVLDLISDGRLELGVGNGGNPSAFAGFELDNADSATRFSSATWLGCATRWQGEAIPGGDTLYPSAARPDGTDLAGDVLGFGRRAGRCRRATG